MTNPGHAGLNLVVNGDFSVGTYADGMNPSYNPAFPDSWTVSGDLSYPEWVYPSNTGYFYPVNVPGTTAHLEGGGSSCRCLTGRQRPATTSRQRRGTVSHAD